MLIKGCESSDICPLIFHIWTCAQNEESILRFFFGLSETNWNPSKTTLKSNSSLPPHTTKPKHKHKYLVYLAKIQDPDILDYMA